MTCRTAGSPYGPVTRKAGMTTQAAGARLAAGLSLEEAAARARVGPRYLRRVETRGGAGYALARRLSALYGCRIDVFLTRP